MSQTSYFAIRQTFDWTFQVKTEPQLSTKFAIRQCPTFSPRIRAKKFGERQSFNQEIDPRCQENII